MQDYEYERNYVLEKNYWWFGGVRKMVHNLLSLACDNQALSQAKILDVGCGTGALLDELKPKCKELWALDISSEALKFCEIRGHNNLILGSADALPFADASFDIVTSIGVIEHLDDDEKYLSEISRVLKNNGKFVMLTSSFQYLWTEHDVANMHKRRYYLRELNSKMQKFKFQKIRFSHLNFILFPLLALILLGHRMLYGIANKNPQRILPMPPLIVNFILKQIILIEAFLMKYVSLPWGISMIGIFIKNETLNK